MEEDMLKKVASRVLKEAGRIDSLVGEFSEVKEESTRSVDSIESRLQSMLGDFEILKDRLQTVESQLEEAQQENSVENLADSAEVEAMRRELEMLRSQNDDFAHKNAVLAATVEQLKKEKAELTEVSGELTRFNAETNVGSAAVVPRENPKGDWCLHKEVVPIIISYKRDIKQLEADLVKLKGRSAVNEKTEPDTDGMSAKFS